MERKGIITSPLPITAVVGKTAAGKKAHKGDCSNSPALRAPLVRLRQGAEPAPAHRYHPCAQDTGIWGLQQAHG